MRSTKTSQNCWMQYLLLLFLTTNLHSSTAHRPRIRPPHLQAASRHRIPSLLVVRGGSSYDDQQTYGDGDRFYNDPSQQDGYQQQQPEYGEMPATTITDPDEDPYDPYYQPDPMHESVQDRLDEWRSSQLEQSQKYQSSLRDEQGRVKLLTSVGKGARAAIFFLFMWRNIYLYDRCANIATSALRMSLTIPTIVLFVLNTAGAVSSLSSPGHSAKKRLKAILNVNKVVELILIVHCLLRLTVIPSPYTAREQYIGGILHSFVFLLQCQGFTRFSWDEKTAQPMSSYAPPPRDDNNVWGADPRTRYQ